MDTLLRRDALRSGLLREMQDFPVLLCPVAAVSAFRHGEREWRIEGRRVRYLDAWRYAAWFNLTGNPAISVPVPGIAERPVGVQIVGRPWAEATVLGIAALLEEAVGIHPSPVLD
jgi:amidase